MSRIREELDMSHAIAARQSREALRTPRGMIGTGTKWTPEGCSTTVNGQSIDIFMTSSRVQFDSLIVIKVEDTYYGIA